MSKRPFSSYSVKQQANMNRYKYMSNVLNNLSRLPYNPLYPDIITEEEYHQVHTLYTTIVSRIRKVSHSFYVCDRCHSVLTGRKPRSDIKHRSYYPCACCKVSYDSNNSSCTHILRSKFTLSEARDYIHTNHPEFFI